jgi:hypothetical protein
VDLYNHSATRFHSVVLSQALYLETQDDTALRSCQCRWWELSNRGNETNRAYKYSVAVVKQAVLASLSSHVNDGVICSFLQVIHPIHTDLNRCFVLCNALQMVRILLCVQQPLQVCNFFNDAVSISDPVFWNEMKTELTR